MKIEVSRIKRRRRIIKRLLTGLALMIVCTCGIVFIQGSWKDENNNVQGEEADKVETGTDVSEEKIIVVVDAGHGGKDEGTSYGSVIEKDINISIAKYVQEELTQRGIEVIMTREDDTFLQLSERTNIANSAAADFFLSIHVDSYYEDCSIRGITGYYTASGSAGDKYAQVFTDVFKNAGYVTRDAVQSDLYVLNHTTMPAVLVETGFISNEIDRLNLTNEQYKKGIATVLADGVIKALEISGVSNKM